MKYKVIKQEWTDFCDHPNCAVLHKNRAKFKWISFPGKYRVENFHEVIRREYIVVNENGDRMGDAYDTAREARRELESRVKAGIYTTEEKTA